jgi:hypothetical protein
MMLRRREQQQQGKEIIEQAQTKFSGFEEEVQSWFMTFSIFGLIIIIGIVVILFIQAKILKELRKLPKED